MRKTTVINGDYFTFKKFTPVFNGNNDIYDIYNKPSCYKIQAFNEWNEKLVEIYGMSGNSCTFSIHGYIKDENWKLHNVRITHDNNYILDESN